VFPLRLTEVTILNKTYRAAQARFSDFGACRSVGVCPDFHRGADRAASIARVRDFTSLLLDKSVN
jgi:hypothetical protein